MESRREMNQLRIKYATTESRREVDEKTFERMRGAFPEYVDVQHFRDGCVKPVRYVD